MNDLDKIQPSPIASQTDAAFALKKIAVADSAADYYRRAKDPGQLFKAVEIKIRLQAEYIVWRDGTVVRVRETGGPGRGKRAPAPGFVLPDSDPGQHIADRWRERFTRKIEGRTVIDPDRLATALADAQRACLRICEQENLGTVRGTEGTGEFERYTPAAYIEPVREVLGEIDLDPATSEKAQETVRANEYFTAEDDGLAQPWHGRVFLNPPYHRQLCPLFIDKLIAEIAAGRVDEAILLTNNCADTEWFDNAAGVCDSLCFTRGRIKFLNQHETEVLPTQGQTFFYYGRDPDKFETVFDRDRGGTIGRCFRPIARDNP
jgi:hypothetical protein